MGGLALYSVSNGNLVGFMAPVDGHNMQCGASPGYEDFKYLYIGNLGNEEKNVTETLNSAYCVRECTGGYPPYCMGNAD